MLLRRWGASRRGWPTLGTVPLLLDEMQLVLEHSVLSDVVFDLILVLAVAALALGGPTAETGGGRARRAARGRHPGAGRGRADRARRPCCSCLLAGVTWRTRLPARARRAGRFAAPLTAYATWYHHAEGSWAITQAGGRALYMRTTAFVDCRRFSMPAYERPLCPTEPTGHRQEPTDYGWHDATTVHALQPPPGVTLDEALSDFARRAIRAQPARLRPGGRPRRGPGLRADPDRPLRVRHRLQVVASSHYVDYVPHGLDRPRVPGARRRAPPAPGTPAADVLDEYGRLVYLPGPLTLVLVLGALAGLARRRAPGAPRPARWHCSCSPWARAWCWCPT